MKETESPTATGFRKAKPGDCQLKCYKDLQKVKNAQ